VERFRLTRAKYRIESLHVKNPKVSIGDFFMPELTAQQAWGSAEWK
jgi:hypothetical protein